MLRRLRTLTEDECYTRCYGSGDATVRIVQILPRLYEPSEQFEVLAEGIGITNAAHRTTTGSSDLRRGDFEGASERLERLARELRPRWIGFVGKEAYRGAFGRRAELGLQEARLA